mmetsp:Transcript_28840/g.73565  ORF Transcript_28840/g.73565 Transcript_28840/m.73565 type:complete len:82 (+) Transcript_28840:385-630(+)
MRSMMAWALSCTTTKSSTGSCSSTGVQLQQSVACQCTAQLVLHADGDDREHVAASCIQPGATHAVAAVHGAAVGRLPLFEG